MTTEPTRLSKAEGPLGQAIRTLPAAPQLTPEQLERIRAATMAAASGSLLGWLLAKGAPFKFFVLGAVFAAGLLIARVGGREPVEAPHEVSALPVTAPSVNTPSVNAPSMNTASVDAPPAPVTVDPLPPPGVAESEEVELLGRAHLANRAHDRARALRELEAYWARFPAGMLDEEATLHEVELRLANHDESRALALLDRAIPASTRRRAEFELVRSELLASLNRCEEALAGFKPLLASAERPLQERAWIGVATCQLHEGRRDPARAALEEYLRRFPSGAQRTLAIELLKDN